MHPDKSLCKKIKRVVDFSPIIPYHSNYVIQYDNRNWKIRKLGKEVTKMFVLHLDLDFNQNKNNRNRKQNKVTGHEITSVYIRH